MDTSLFKDLYLFELDRKEKLAQGINGLITALTIVGGILAYGLQTYTFSAAEPGAVIVGVFSIAAIGSYAVALYHTLQHFHVGRDYRAIATSSPLWEHYQALLDYFAAESDPKAKADSAFNEYLNAVYAEATDVNAEINYYRGDRQKRAYTFLTYAVAFALLAFLTYYVSDALK